MDRVDLVIGKQVGMRLNQNKGDVKDEYQEPAQRAMLFQNITNGIDRLGDELFDDTE